MDADDVAHRRLRSLRLTGPPLATAEEVVRWLGAVQSQDYGPAKWAVGARTAGLDDAAVDRAVIEGRILRTHVLRPTWHFVLPADIRWLLALTAPRVHALNAYYYRQQDLDARTLGRCGELIAGALEGGHHRTRAELRAVLEGAGVAAVALRLGYILIHAELEGVICSGAPRGRQQTYALLEERVPPAPPRSREEALAELTARYFTSHGPATAKDFSWWSSLNLADIKAGLALAAPRLRHEVIGDVSYWSAAPPPPSPPAAAGPVVHLLQAFDEYVVGYTQSRYALDLSGAAEAKSGLRPVFNHVVILDSQVAGHWKRTISRREVRIEVVLYVPMDDAQAQALQRAADRHGAFLGLPATVAARQPGFPL